MKAACTQTRHTFQAKSDTRASVELDPGGGTPLAGILVSALTCTCSIGRAGPLAGKPPAYPQRLGFPVNWDGPPRASKQAGTAGWDGAGPGRVGSGGVRAGGKGVTSRLWGLLRLLLLYLFIFRRFLGGVATGAGRKGWEGEETGREGCAGSA